MLYFVFTVDGDWKEYFNAALPEEKRLPDKQHMLSLVEREIGLATRVLGDKFIHFIHTSFRAKDFFLQPEFVKEWRQIEEGGGSVGVHCHADDPGRAYWHDDPGKMEEMIGFFTDALEENNLSPVAFRGGYMSFSSATIPILEENGIFLDFSCDPGRYLLQDGRPVSDWRGAPDNFYRMSYEDHRQPGDSRIFEIPLGVYIETEPLWKIWKKARQFKRRGEKMIFSVLAHSYDFSSFKMRLKIRLALSILRKYGKFISAQEVLTIVNSGDKER